MWLFYHYWTALFLMLVSLLLTATENIKKWWIWGYWMSPMMYAQNAIVVNEFLGKSWRHVISWISHCNLFLVLLIIVWHLNLFFSITGSPKLNRITRNWSFEVPRILYTFILVLDRSRGINWIYITFQCCIHSGSHLSQSWVLPPYPFQDIQVRDYVVMLYKQLCSNGKATGCYIRRTSKQCTWLQIWKSNSVTT